LNTCPGGGSNMPRTFATGGFRTVGELPKLKRENKHQEQGECRRRKDTGRVRAKKNLKNRDSGGCNDRKNTRGLKRGIP